MAGGTPLPGALEQLVHDCLDEEQYDAAVQLVDECLASRFLPSTAIIRRLLCLSVCSVDGETQESAPLGAPAPGPSRTTSFLRPLPSAVRHATVLLYRVWAASPHGESFLLSALPSPTEGDAIIARWEKRSRTPSSTIEEHASTPLRLWADEVLPAAYADIWDWLAHAPKSEAEPVAPVSLARLEFWMGEKEERLLQGSTKAVTASQLEGADLGSAVTLTEGAWRTLDCFVRIWEKECAQAGNESTFRKMVRPEEVLRIAFSFQQRCPTLGEIRAGSRTDHDLATRSWTAARMYALLWGFVPAVRASVRHHTAQWLASVNLETAERFASDVEKCDCPGIRYALLDCVSKELSGVTEFGPVASSDTPPPKLECIPDTFAQDVVNLSQRIKSGKGQSIQKWLRTLWSMVFLLRGCSGCCGVDARPGWSAVQSSLEQLVQRACASTETNDAALLGTAHGLAKAAATHAGR